MRIQSLKSATFQAYCLIGLDRGDCLNYAIFLWKTNSPEALSGFFCYLYIWNLLFKTKMLSPVGGLYDTPYKIRKFVMQQKRPNAVGLYIRAELTYSNEQYL